MYISSSQGFKRCVAYVMWVLLRVSGLLGKPQLQRKDENFLVNLSMAGRLISEVVKDF